MTIAQPPALSSSSSIQNGIRHYSTIATTPASRPRAPAAPTLSAAAVTKGGEVVVLEAGATGVLVGVTAVVPDRIVVGGGVMTTTLVEVVGGGTTADV
jgi:hypothetical protein